MIRYPQEVFRIIRQQRSRCLLRVCALNFPQRQKFPTRDFIFIQSYVNTILVFTFNMLSLTNDFV